MADPVVTDHPEEGRFEITVEGKLAGATYYNAVGQNLDFTHTEIDPAYEGQGLGSTLIKAALDTTRERGLGALPHCPFVKRYIERHPDYLDLVPAKRRSEFGLPE